MTRHRYGGENAGVYLSKQAVKKGRLVLDRPATFVGQVQHCSTPARMRKSPN